MFTQAYFENIKEIILKELSQAKSSINVAVAWFTDFDLFEMLIKKKEENIDVELIITKDDINSNSTIDFKKLLAKGGRIFWADPDNGSFMHNKFCVIDGTIVISGSYNWTNKAQYNYESITLIKDCPHLAYEFMIEFRNIRSKISGHKDNSAIVDFSEICLRLEAIKSLLLVREMGIANDQIKKLKIQGKFDNSLVAWFIYLGSLIEKGFIHESISFIDEFISRQRAITLFTDHEIIALRLEVFNLSIQVQALDVTKSDMEKILHLFQLEYNKQLGKLILKILKLKAKIQLNDDESHKKAKNDFDEFNKTYHNLKNEKIFKLNNEEEIELKKCYKQASKLCHPDLVYEKQKEEAQKIFIELKSAYDKNDLQTVKEILMDLEKGIFHERIKNISEKLELLIEVKRLRLVRRIIEEEINRIKVSDAYVTVNSIGDWNEYFDKKKRELDNYLQTLT